MLVKTKFKNLHFAPNMLLKMHQLRNADDKLEYVRQCMHSAEKQLKSRKAQVNYPRPKGRELVRLPLLPQGD